jgi:hypothetical protein
MKMERSKNTLLISLIVLSQIHTLFRGMDFNLVWLLNGVEKSPSFSVFLLSHHITALVLIYLLYINSKQKKLTLFLLILSFLDILHFFILSGFGFELEKILLTLFIYFLTQVYKWRK